MAGTTSRRRDCGIVVEWDSLRHGHLCEMRVTGGIVLKRGRVARRTAARPCSTAAAVTSPWPSAVRTAPVLSAPSFAKIRELAVRPRGDATHLPYQMNTGRARTILLADDNVDAADTLGAFLEMLGFQVRVVHDGAAAVREATAELPDIAILDLGMPGLDGWATCRAIRSLPRGATVRVVALSGWGSAEVRLKSQQAGFDAHWTKPAEAETLIQMLRDN